MALISSLTKKEADKILSEIYESFEKKVGSAPEWLRVMAHRPEIAKEFTELFRVVMMEKGEIEPELRWKIAYVISKELKCPFCVDVTKGMLEKMGVEEKTLQEIEKGVSEEEGKIMSLVRDVTQDGHLDEPRIFEELRTRFSEAQIVEIVSVIGFFNYINRFNNTLGVLPE